MKNAWVTGKGPAVRALLAQQIKNPYSKEMRKTVENQAKFKFLSPTMIEAIGRMVRLLVGDSPPPMYGEGYCHYWTVYAEILEISASSL